MWRHREKRVQEEGKVKNRIRTFTLAAGVLSAALMTACGSRAPADEEYESFVYCLNADATGLVKEEYDIPDGEPQEQAEEILEKLAEQSDDLEHISPIPEDVDVLGCVLNGSILDVDFSDTYLDIERTQEKLVRAAVVQSLVQVEGINAVRFMIDGEPFPSSYQTDMLTLYFANEDGDKLVQQNTSVRYSSNVSKDKLIVEKLMQGPAGSSAGPTINPNANLLSVTTKDEICYVNFDSTFLTGAYDVLPEVTVYSIVNSLVEGTGVKQVQITINGETNAEYMDAVDLSQPLSENRDLLAVKDDE